MKVKAASGIMLTLLLIGMLTLAFNIQQAKASGTIHIRADGSVDPPTAPITTVDNVTYTFTGNITSDADGIVVERSNIIIDGNGFTLQGSGGGKGFYLYRINEVTIRNTTITGFGAGVFIQDSRYNTISENSITVCYDGIYLYTSSSVYDQFYNTICGNNIRDNTGRGIVLGYATFFNAIFENNVTNNSVGVRFGWATENKIYHNNLVNNTLQASFKYDNADNVWDNGYPSGGNYWSDYTGPDLNEDGIGDTYYILNEDNKDYYPVMRPWGLQLPVVRFAYSEHPLVNETIAFDASASYDRDGSIANYEWDFGDGNVTSVTDPTITHVFTATGTYTVSLTVTDNDGFNRNITKSVTVKLYRSSITLSVDSATVPVGSNVTIGGTITPTRVGVDVTIFNKPSDGTWTKISTVQTDFNSNYTCTWKTTYVSTHEIKANWTGDEDTWQAESQAKAVVVQGYTIYIRPDGSVDPSTTPIQRYGDMYTFTDNIYAPITVERDNITINGDGYELQGSGGGSGFYLSGINNVTIKNMEIKECFIGISLDESSNNTITGNTITGNEWMGITLDWYANNNIISGNNVKNNWKGIVLYDHSSNNSVSGNNITNNNGGIWVQLSNNNSVYRNNITNNDYGITLGGGSSHNIISGNNITQNNNVGIRLYESSINNIHGNNVKNNTYGIDLGGSSHNIISGNNITNNNGGVWLYSSSNNSLSGNNITQNNDVGIRLDGSDNNTMYGNNMSDNEYGIRNRWSSDNKFYHNNFIDNTKQVYSSDSTNTWDDGYPSGGNYWSDYTGDDLYSGLYQNETDSDGIGDIPYTFSWPNQDNYPLMIPMGSPQLPIAIFTYFPEYPVVDETATFNATSSYDRDGSIISYQWNFGDGNSDTGVAVTHAYLAEGTYTVTLNVTDDDGLTDVATADITVSPPPVHDIAVTSVTAPTEAIVGEIVPIRVEVANQGTVDETFDVMVSYDMTVIGTQTVNLPAGDSATVDFDWNTTELTADEYIINVTVPVDDDLNNNFKTTTIKLKQVVFPVKVDGWEFNVVVESNSTVSDFEFRKDQKEISFSVTGPEGTVGFCNVTIPMDLMTGDSSWLIRIDDIHEPETLSTSDNGTHTFLYFTYTHTTHNVKIRGIWVVPEFSTWTSMLLILILLSIAIAITKRRQLKTPIH